MLDMPSPEPPPPVVPPPPLVVAPPPPVVRVNRTLRPIPRIIPEALPVEQPQSGALAHAADSVRAARHLQETVLERIHKAGELRGAVTHSSPVFVPKRGVSALRKDFRSRDDLRRAFVASLVFGPPKALDDGSEVRA